jgi:hypothetical protein
MNYLTRKEWWTAAGIRAAKTCVQSGAAILATQAATGNVNFVTILETALLAGIASIGTSLAGLPELENKDK